MFEGFLRSNRGESCSEKPRESSVVVCGVQAGVLGFTANAARPQERELSLCGIPSCSLIADIEGGKYSHGSAKLRERPGRERRVGVLEVSPGGVEEGGGRLEYNGDCRTRLGRNVPEMRRDER